MNKMLKISISLIFVFLLLNIMLTHYSNAAIQIKEDTQRNRSISVNKMFDNCYNMRNQASTLGNNNLDPHLCNARDWGAMWYLGMSSYGSAKLGSGVQMEGKTYSSLNGNMSGVMYDTSSAPGHSYNAAIGMNVTGGSVNTTNNSQLYADTNKKYVDKISSPSETLGMALNEVTNWTNGSDSFSSASGNTHPVLYRSGYYGTYNGSGRQTGNADANYTYRPVIWN